MAKKIRAYNSHRGSSFDDFLKEEGIYEECKAYVVKRMLAEQVAEEMKEQNISKAEMARRMNSSRAAVDRLLDPNNASVTLLTLMKAASAIGCDLAVGMRSNPAG